MTTAKIKKLAEAYNDLDDIGKQGFTEEILKPEADSQDNPDTWQPLSMADIFEPMPPVEFIAGGLLERESCNILYGPPGTLKSFVLQDLALCVATGQNWIRPAPWGDTGKAIPTTQAAVWWIDFDMGQRRTRERFAALGRHHKATNETPLTVYSMPNPPLDAGDMVHVDLLAQRTMGAGLIVIDNLRTVSGGRDENDSRMSEIMFNLRWLAELTGAAVVVIHHERKGAGFNSRAGDSLRGHSSIEAAIDLALKVEREPHANLITIKSTKTRGLEVLPFSAVFTFEPRADGSLESACFYSVESEDNQSDYAIDREIKSILTNNPLKQSDAMATVKEQLPEVGLNRIRDRLQQLAANDKIQVRSGSYNRKIYSVPVPPTSQKIPGLDND